MWQGTYATWLATYNKQAQGKVPIFKPKAPSFYTTEFSYINYKLFTINNRPNVGFLSEPRSKIMKKYLFLLIYVFFGAELKCTKT